MRTKIGSWLLVVCHLLNSINGTCAGFWPYVTNTEEDDDEDVLDGSQWHQTINIRPWQENVIGTNDAYFHTVAWCRAWGTYPRSRWEVAARTTRREIAVPLPKRPKRATARNYNYVLVSNARPRECAILSQPDARAGRTRGLLSDDIDWMNWARHEFAQHDMTKWAEHDTTAQNTTGTTDTTKPDDLGICHGSIQYFGKLIHDLPKLSRNAYKLSAHFSMEIRWSST